MYFSLSPENKKTQNPTKYYLWITIKIRGCLFDLLEGGESYRALIHSLAAVKLAIALTHIRRAVPALLSEKFLYASGCCYLHDLRSIVLS